ncbi:flavodoxin family protein [Streptomyces sp. NPDC003035]|uniref:flavodoxin family protein n=1 Tax=Streptomyces sp. NPDC003035 TaxID=3364676 RepID=UPI00369C0721
MRPRVAVVYHSRRGTMRALALAAAEGARAGGARVRVLRVADEGADEGVNENGRWPEPLAGPDDVLWADGLVLATPTYFGNVSASFKRFLETTSPLWRKGLLADRLVTGMTASTCTHGGREATLLSLHQTAYHWGSWVVGADPADPVFRSAGGNPYGVSVEPRPRGTDGAGTGTGIATAVGAAEQEAARALGHRLAELTARARPAPAAPTVPGPVKVTVVHCADSGPARLLAQECAAGARSVGARVRLRRVVGTSGPARAEAAGWNGPPAALATPADVAWADAVVFGGPARVGAMAPPLLEFLQSLEPAAGPGPLSGKPASGFVATARPHAGSESALLAFHHVLLHSGAVVVPPGYTDPAVFTAGGNPYGTSHPLTAGDVPTPAVREAARHQGRRAALSGDLLRRATDASTESIPSTESIENTRVIA